MPQRKNISKPGTTKNLRFRHRKLPCCLWIAYIQAWPCSTTAPPARGLLPVRHRQQAALSSVEFVVGSRCTPHRRNGGEEVDSARSPRWLHTRTLALRRCDKPRTAAARARGCFAIPPRGFWLKPNGRQLPLEPRRVRELVVTAAGLGLPRAQIAATGKPIHHDAYGYSARKSRRAGGLIPKWYVAMAVPSRREQRERHAPRVFAGPAGRYRLEGHSIKDHRFESERRDARSREAGGSLASLPAQPSPEPATCTSLARSPRRRASQPVRHAGGGSRPLWG